MSNDELGLPNSCLLCKSQWGNYWGEVNNSSKFFCCEVCYQQYMNLVQAIRFQTGWREVERIELSTETRKRTGKAISGDKVMHFVVSFDLRGEIWSFNPLFPDRKGLV